MTCKIVAFTILIFLSIGAGSLRAEDRFHVDGKVLQSICSSAMRGLDNADTNSKNEADKTDILVDVYSCIYYVIGATDGFYAMERSKTEEDTEIKPPYCIPEDVTNNTVVQTILDYLKAHPDAQKEKGAVAILQALQDKYPCDH